MSLKINQIYWQNNCGETEGLTWCKKHTYIWIKKVLLKKQDKVHEKLSANKTFVSRIQIVTKINK